ncbi:MAG: sulfur carrier protein ThiS [Thermoleophilia bacterium]|nr:sulfur carrier protein ThiS [Thermoleophilia bacterium]MDH3724612.1 sulfur carrier protein ThiS [Thermoleophilia bacterium]
MSVNVSINGTSHSLSEDSTLADAASLFGVTPGESGIAAAVNGRVVPRRNWTSTPLGNGAIVEVVRATAGG